MPLLGIAGVHQMREDAYAVNPQILGEQTDVIVDVPIHARPHVLEDPLVDLEDGLVALLRDNWVGALVQSLRKQDLVGDVGRRVIGEEHLDAGQPKLYIGPLVVGGEVLEQLAEGFVEVVRHACQLLASLDVHSIIK